MRAIVVRAALILTAAGGLTAAFLVPLDLDDASGEPGRTLQMPAATLQTTVSVFPAPGRPESSPLPARRPADSGAP